MSVQKYMPTATQLEIIFTHIDAGFELRFRKSDDGLHNLLLPYFTRVDKVHLHSLLVLCWLLEGWKYLLYRNQVEYRYFVLENS